MTTERDSNPYEDGTWEGARRSLVRESLALSVEGRLRALDELAETAEALAAAGRQARVDRKGDVRVTEFPGIRSTPLASYLKGLGLLRIITEQADVSARGWWGDGGFLLQSPLDNDAVVRLLLHDYRPSPILAPWNGGSGFYPDKDRTEGIDGIADGAAARFTPLRKAIAHAREILKEMNLSERPGDKETKRKLLQRLRGEWDEAAVQWMDAAVLLTEDDPRYPPLLGTGGNDGRLEFTNNFMQRLVELFDPDSGAPEGSARPLLREALFTEPVPALRSSSIGQFAPGAAGGPNASTSFDGDSLVNPWDFVLMLEGAVLFAAAATRRLESATASRASFPFTVDATGAGTGAADSSDAADARGEIWLPLWDRPASLVELRALIGEGRATVGRRNARDGIDFARAIARLGVGRGVNAFERYGFLQRYGRTYLATPLNRVPVRANATAELIDQLETYGWLGRFQRLTRRNDAPGRLSSLGRRLDDALFDLALRGDQSPQVVQATLVVLGNVMRYLANSPGAREWCGPVPLLGDEWVRRADDGSPEFRIAASLASVHAMRRAADSPDGTSRARQVLPMASHLAPVDASRRHRWAEEADHLVVWGAGSFEDNLRRALERRILEADGAEGVTVPLESWLPAPLSAIGAWFDGRLDAGRAQDLLLGLALVWVPHDLDEPPESRPVQMPAVYRILKPLFSPPSQLYRVFGVEVRDAPRLSIDVVRMLGTGHVADAVRTASTRLRPLGLARPPHLTTGPLDHRRLLAALMVPVTDRDLRAMTRILTHR